MGVTFTEVVYLVIATDASALAGLGGFLLPVLLGNTAGGGVLVTVVNYFQTTVERLDVAREDGTDRRLGVREWLFGAGETRSYVPQRSGED